MAYLLCIVDAPGFPRRTVVESTIPPSHLWLSGKRPYGLLLVSLPYLSVPFIVSTRSSEYSYRLIYLLYQFLSTANLREFHGWNRPTSRNAPRTRRRYPTRRNPTRTDPALSHTGAIYLTRTDHTYHCPVRVDPSTSQLKGYRGDDTRYTASLLDTSGTLY